MPYPRVCEECGNEFVPDYKDHTYCSSECAKGEPNMNTAKHTPELLVCTCRIRHETVDTGIGAYEEYYIKQCPLHTAAPAMYEALSKAHNIITNILTDSQLDTRTPCGQTIRRYRKTVEQALAQAEGR